MAFPVLEWIIWLHLVFSALMTGIIWLVQLVHYPSFQFIDPGQFKKFHQMHSRKITWIVAPVMLLELVTAILLFWDTQMPSTVITANLVLLVLTFVATAFLSVPIHNQLAQKGYDSRLIKKLTLTNWPRTFFWTLRLIVLLISI